MELRRVSRFQHWPAAREVMLKRAGRKDRDPPALGRNGTDQVGAAEDQQRLDVVAGDPFEQLLLGVGLFEHPRIDVVDGNATWMALCLDREDAARPNQDVIDVAVPQ